NCEIPENDYMFRYYLHDIWWMNSPWYDRYEENPYDIYIPMALSRIDEAGKTQSPTMMNILAIDNSFGNMPENCVNEVIPHFLKAEKNAPDEPAPLVLVYPVREYTTDKGEMLSEMYFGDGFIQKALNSGFPIASAVSADIFKNHSLEIYKRSVLVVPAGIRDASVLNKLKELADNNGKIIVYGSKERLDEITFACKKADIFGPVGQLAEAFEEFGWSVRFKKAGEDAPLPALTFSRSNNALYVSAYNRNTLTETYLKTPLGAPILNGCDTRLVDGYAVYTFGRTEHRECRVFVKQKSGIVRSRERAPVNRKYRRKIQITGLEDAEVFLFAESYCDLCAVVGGDSFSYDNAMDTPQDFWEYVDDPENGRYLHAKNVSGTIYFAMPFKDRI
ncbi:MAG: hypothetical protein IKM06_05235, partial [Clostridia bacterium]|nr:hypothetical protein [Clostridia bacterium]